ncbi:MAG: hybrid sensor histidine kinase/response regulator [Balneolaceae bacterium]
MRTQQFQPKHYRIFIIDDAKANILLISHVLKSVGYEVFSATSGMEALQRIDEIKPDLVLLDIVMPGMSGYKVIEELKKSKHKNIPIIFLSALTDSENKIDAFKAGAVDYINKPFNKGEVLERIKTHLKIRRFEIERKEHINILKNREIELRQLNKNKDALIRIVSHDIKNPLTGIMGLISILLNDDSITYEERKEILNVMQNSSEKLLDLVKKILDDEANHTNSSKLVLSETNLGELVQKVIELNKAKARLKNIELKCEISSPNIVCNLDYRKIETTLINLVSNALKFTLSNGSVTIRVDKTEDSILIQIQDTGIGIPAPMVDSFFELDKLNSTIGTDNEVGTGLGINIVKSNVDLHKGKIWLETEEEVGTTFFIELPTDLK